MNESEVMVEVTFKGEEPVIYVFDYYSVELSKWSGIGGCRLSIFNDDEVMKRFLKTERDFNPETDTIKQIEPAYINLGDWEDGGEG